jgi:pimeloyl-ACP methyl ester carboxylesterase
MSSTEIAAAVGLGLVGLGLFAAAARPQRGTLSRSSPPPADGVMVSTASAGATWCRLRGRVGGRFVVCVHGFSLPSRVAYTVLAERLAAGGARVLTYDLPGRGHSDDGGADQTPEFFVAHLAQLLFALGEPGSERIDLFGTSMGGAIAVAFGATFPRRVRSLTLIAPAGLSVHVPLSGTRLACVLCACVLRVLHERVLCVYVCVIACVCPCVGA